MATLPTPDIDGLSKQVRHLEDSVSDLKSRFVSVENRVKGMDNYGGKLDDLGVQLTNVATNLKVIQTSINEQAQTLADHHVLLFGSERIQAIGLLKKFDKFQKDVEEKIEGISKQMGTMNTDIADIKKTDRERQISLRWLTIGITVAGAGGGIAGVGTILSFITGGP